MAALARIGGGGLSFPVCVCLSAGRSTHQPLSTGLWGCRNLYTPDPGNDVIGTAPNPFPHPSGGPAAVRSALSLRPLASGVSRSPALGLLRGGCLASRRWQGALANSALFEVSPSCCVRGQIFPVSGPCVPPMSLQALEHLPCS